MTINERIDAFITCNSLVNARKLVAHINRHPMAMCMLTEDHEGQVRNAQRMVDSAKWRAACRPPVTPLAAATTCKIAEAADKLK